MRASGMTASLFTPNTKLATVSDPDESRSKCNGSGPASYQTASANRTPPSSTSYRISAAELIPMKTETCPGAVCPLERRGPPRATMFRWLPAIVVFLSETSLISTPLTWMPYALRQSPYAAYCHLR